MLIIADRSTNNLTGIIICLNGYYLDVGGFLLDKILNTTIL